MVNPSVFGAEPAEPASPPNSSRPTMSGREALYRFSSSICAFISPRFRGLPFQSVCLNWPNSSIIGKYFSLGRENDGFDRSSIFGLTGVLRIPINASGLKIHESASMPSTRLTLRSSIIVLHAPCEEKRRAASSASGGRMNANLALPDCPGAAAKIERA